LCSYRTDEQEEHVLWPEMSHLLQSSAKWTTNNKKRKSGEEGEQLLMQLKLQCCSTVDHCCVRQHLYAQLACQQSGSGQHRRAAYVCCLSVRVLLVSYCAVTSDSALGTNSCCSYLLHHQPCVSRCSRQALYIALHSRSSGWHQQHPSAAAAAGTRWQAPTLSTAATALRRSSGSA
jgi:hypothetical protein